MPALRTELTEIVTGLGMLGFADLDHALSAPPRALIGAGHEALERLRAEFESGAHAQLFAAAWANGQVFAKSDDGLRGRPPWRVEWKGPDKPPGYEQIPADLRVDHVYLISCKYGSSILHNSSPGNLFDRRLAGRGAAGLSPAKVSGQRSAASGRSAADPETVVDSNELGSRGPSGGNSAEGNWFVDVAAEEFQLLWDRCRSAPLDGGESCGELPANVDGLGPAHKDALRALLGAGRGWPNGLEGPWREFARVLSERSAERWRVSVRKKAVAEEMLWRLLRLQAAPYFVLGAATDGTPLRYRVGTPWDFRKQFAFRRLEITPLSAGQPKVAWRGVVQERDGGAERVVDGHVEIRWSHGRFVGSPEAKVYLDTPAADVPGYVPLA